jgi:cation transport ATPase
MTATTTAIPTAPSSWLRTLYLTRAAFSVTWVALAFTVAQTSPVVASVLLVLYPAWDALANALDAKKSGGLSANPLQTINTVISAITTAAMAVAVARGMSAVFVVFGTWAVLSGLLQLGTALKRWKTSGAQWAMALSGAQSALAGVLFVTQANGPDPMLQKLAGYAAVGALYFLISASVLLYREARKQRL